MIHQSEHQLQNAVLDYLPYLGVKAIRINSGMFAVGDEGHKRLIRGAQAGTPDIIGCRNGQFIAIELKVGKNKPTDAQKRNLEEWLDHGAIAFVARSVNDVVGVLNGTLKVKGFEIVW